MNKFISLLMIFALLMTACNSGREMPAEVPEEASIRSFLEEYYVTMSARDWEAYRSFFAPDATLTTIWAQEQDTLPVIHTNSISEFIAQTKDGPDSQPIFEEKMLEAEITVRNNLAQAWVRYEAKFGTEDNLMKWKGMDLFSLIRHENEWKIVSIVFEGE